VELIATLLTLNLVVTLLAASLVAYNVYQGGKIMAFSDEVIAAVEEIKAGVDAAVADIQGLHAKLDAALEAGDIAAARAALAEIAPKLAALAEAVAVPE